MKATKTANRSAGETGEQIPKVIDLQRIMVPLDFSEHARKALRYAVKLAEQFGSEIELVNVVTPTIYAEGIVFPVAMENLELENKKHAREQLERITRDAAVEHITWKTTVLMGSPYDEIVRLAMERQTDLLLITTHGRTGLQHFLLGSTAERILRHAPCPVMVVRDKEHEFV